LVREVDAFSEGLLIFHDVEASVTGLKQKALANFGEELSRQLPATPQPHPDPGF
jgi:hypothetical protein